MISLLSVLIRRTSDYSVVLVQYANKIDVGTEWRMSIPYDVKLTVTL